MQLQGAQLLLKVAVLLQFAVELVASVVLVGNDVFLDVLLLFEELLSGVVELETWLVELWSGVGTGSEVDVFC